MKAGDKVWSGPLTVVDGPFVFGGVWVQECDAISTDECHPPALTGNVIPDHPALPAVARWLAEHGDDALMAFAYHWLNSGDDGRFPQTDGAARSLIAALTEATR